MGKVKKIKEQRKTERIESQEKKSKRKNILIRSVFTIFLFAFITIGIVYSYDRWYPSSFWPKIKKVAVKESADKKEEIKKGEKMYSKAPEMTIDSNKAYVATVKTSFGSIEIELFAKSAPKTVNNFVFLAKEKFYDNLPFHRIIKEFMIQGGCPKGDGTGDPGYKFDDEINADSPKLEKGILAMANSGANTNGSQFFIVTKDKTEWLDGKHTPFGRVTKGMDVVSNIENAKTDTGDKPTEAIIIQNVVIEEK